MINQEKFVLLNHSLVQDKLAMLRDKNTNTRTFREVAKELSIILAVFATQDSKVIDKSVETPLGVCECKVFSNDHFVIVPILRAGLIMSEALLTIINASVGHVGMYRDHDTLQPIEYYFKMPKNVKDKEFLVCDPMLATANTASLTIDRLKKEGITNIKFLSLLSCRQGVINLQKAHPDILIYTCGFDETLTENGYIYPGLGDAGDRIYGTK